MTRIDRTQRRRPYGRSRGRIDETRHTRSTSDRVRRPREATPSPSRSVLCVCVWRQPFPSVPCWQSIEANGAALPVPRPFASARACALLVRATVGGANRSPYARHRINDPYAGSPTKTLLRLLLPRSDQVRTASRAGGATVSRRMPPAVRGPH